MSNKLPQYSDPLIRFDDIHYNISPSTIDFDDIDDFICCVAKSRTNASGTNLVQIEYSAQPSRFTIDNDNKIIDVQFLSSEVGNEAGCYFVNLWLVQNNIYMSHLIKEFEIVPSVTYS